MEHLFPLAGATGILLKACRVDINPPFLSGTYEIISKILFGRRVHK